jgi:hypothetical protein
MFLFSGGRLACCDGIINAFNLTPNPSPDPTPDPSPPPNPLPANPLPANPSPTGGKTGKATSKKKRNSSATAGKVRQIDLNFDTDRDATTTIQAQNTVESGANQCFWSYTTIALMGMAAIIR